jgi:hypothetical protein
MIVWNKTIKNVTGLAIKAGVTIDNKINSQPPFSHSHIWTVFYSIL